VLTEIGEEGKSVGEKGRLKNLIR